MLLGSGTIQMTGESLSAREVNDFCHSLQSHGIRFLSLRNCKLGDKEFKLLLKAVGLCKSILQLNLSLGLVQDRFRVEIVAQAIVRNRSLRVLALHGNHLGDEGVAVICQAISQHPHINSLDFGDCGFSDEGLDKICDLLPPNGAKPGIQDLTLSANTGITARGWAKLSMAIGVSSMLRCLYLDYNTLGDYGAGCLAVALAANRRIEVVDLEGTGLTEHTAKLYLHLVKSYPLKLKRLVLSENRVHRSTVEAIRTCLRDYEEQDADAESVSDYSDSLIGQTGEATEVKLRSVEMPRQQNESQTDVSNPIDGLAALMNTPVRKAHGGQTRSKQAFSDHETTAVKTSAQYSTPKTSNQLPTTSKSVSALEGRGKNGLSVSDTQDWGEELQEVPL